MPSPYVRRRWAVGGTLFAVVLLALAGWLGLRGLAAQDRLVSAQGDLAAARAALEDGDVATARAAIQRAGTSTARARQLTGDPVWDLAAVLPRLGATPRTIRGVARAADDVARFVLPSALEGLEALAPDQLRGPGGAVDLARVRAGTPPVAEAAGRSAEVVDALAELPSDRSVRRVGARADDLLTDAREVADALDGAAQALRIAPVLLGEDRPRRYLLLVQQTSEARGTGGIPGGYVEVVAQGGTLTTVSTGSNSSLRNGLIEPPPGLSEDFVRIYEPNRAFVFWQNVGVGPNLPEVAKVVEARWQAQGGEPLDGVVLLDAVALSMILEGGEPLELENGQVAPDDLVEYLAVGQYRDFAPTRPGDIDQSRERKDQLEEVAAQVAQRIAGGGGDTRALLLGVVEAVQSGHLRMASADPLLGPLLAEAGVDGALPEGPAPVAYAVVTNGTAGKLDYFLDRRVSYEAGDCSGLRRRSVVAVELTSTVPDTELPPYLTAQLTPNGVTTTRTMNFGLSVYVTRGADLLRATVDGAPVAPETPGGVVLSATTEEGLPRYAVQLDVPPGQTRVLRLELDEPTAPGAPRVPEQPLARPLTTDVAVPVCGDPEPARAAAR